jgi:hypothetical protein
MIGIRNISKPPTPYGENLYELFVVGKDEDGVTYQKTIGTFTHVREEQLATLLEKAAKCAEEARMKEIIGFAEVLFNA